MDHNCIELIHLNQMTFDAEAMKSSGDETWESVLKHVLAEEFVIRRSNAMLPNQSRTQMLDWIQSHPAGERTIVTDDVRTWCSGTLGVVVSPLTMVREDNQIHRYQNVKVFHKDPDGTWQCIYWQVTEMPTT